MGCNSWPWSCCPGYPHLSSAPRLWALITVILFVESPESSEDGNPCEEREEGALGGETVKAASTLHGLSSAEATLTTFSWTTWGRTVLLLQHANSVGAELIQ